LRPTDLGVRLRLFDVALQEDDDARMKGSLGAIRRLEGEGGPLGRYDEARRLISRATRGDKSGLAQARAELAEVSKRRPVWPRVPLCLGQIDELEGNADRALESYLRAVELGERQPDVVRRVVQMLYDRQRYPEAEVVIQRLPEGTPLSGDLRRLAAQVSLQGGDAKRALDLAGKAVAADSTDHRDYVWLGQMLWAASRQTDLDPGRRREAEGRAEKALRKAVELGADKPDAWVALVEYLVRVGQADKAEAVVREAEGKLPADQAPLALAQCYAALNHAERAKELFDAAVRAKPEDLTVLRTAADFSLRTNDIDAATKRLRKVIELGVKDPEAAAWAEPVLAVVLASQGDYQDSREALALLGLLNRKADALPPPAEDVDRERSRAVVLALQPGRQARREAVALLERLNARRPLSPEDQFLLIQLYEQVGEPAQAREGIPLLLQVGDGARPRYLAYAVGVSIDHRRFDEAEDWLKELEKAQPQGLRGVFLRARLLKARGKGPEGVSLLKRQADGKDTKTVRTVASLVEELGDGSAEELYRRYAAEAREPEAALVLAGYLGRCGRTADALDVCDRAWETCPAAAVAEASLTALHAGRPDEAQLARVGRRLQAALEKQPGQPALTLCLASLEELRGRYDSAVALYRKVLQSDGRNVVAKNNLAVAENNLAWILALRDGKGEEALAHAGRAVEILGPRPEVLDTRAVADLAAGRIDAALDDLQAALDCVEVDGKVRASLEFHLARAYARAGNREEAKNAWQEGAAHGLTADLLHPLERAEYAKLAGDFGGS
jgi:tetratricopeptide (TPR) repeat protein